MSQKTPLLTLSGSLEFEANDPENIELCHWNESSSNKVIFKISKGIVLTDLEVQEAVKGNESVFS